MPAGALFILSLGGREEEPMTVTPMVRFFKQAIRKHTRFAVEETALLFSGFPSFGQRVSATIPRDKGDMIRDMYLEITLPELPAIGGGSEPSYVNGIGHVLIERISIEIGEKEIDFLDSYWLDFYAETALPEEKRIAFNKMTGRFPPFATNFGPFVQANTTLLIPIPFWFRDTPLPICAIQSQDVIVRLKFRDLQSVVTDAADILDKCAISDALTIANGGQLEIPNVKLWIEYIHLDREERISFSMNNEEQLIHTHQTLPPRSIPTGQITINEKFALNRSIKLMWWFLQRQNAANLGEFFNYTTRLRDEITPTTPADIITDAEIQFDGVKITGEIPRSAAYYRQMTPYKRLLRVPDNYYYIYSPALDPLNYQPSGHFNGSRITNIQLRCSLNQNATNTELATVNTHPYYLQIGALSYNVLKISKGYGGLLFFN